MSLSGMEQSGVRGMLRAFMVTEDELDLLKRALLDQRDLLQYGRVRWERPDDISQEDVADAVKGVNDLLTLLDR